MSRIPQAEYPRIRLLGGVAPALAQCLCFDIYCQILERGRSLQMEGSPPTPVLSGRLRERAGRIGRWRGQGLSAPFWARWKD